MQKGIIHPVIPTENGPTASGVEDLGAPVRIVEAAAALFARKGVEQTSLREITALARVNIAAVNYHFGSKEALVSHVFETIAARVNGQRRAELDVLVAAARATSRPIDMEAVLRSLIRPYLDPASRDEAALLARLILRHKLAPTPQGRQILQAHFDTLARRYIALFVQICPDLSLEDFYWRYVFAINSVLLNATDRSADNRIRRLSGGTASILDTRTAESAVLTFLCGAMSPAP